MDNNELDRILKERLNGKIEPSLEIQEKIAKKIEEQKKVKTLEMKEKNITTNVKDKNKNKEEKIKKHKNITKILSMVAVILLVFTIGVNYRLLPNGQNTKSELVSIKAIEPTKLESGILANNSEFLITAEGKNVSEEDIQKSIYVEPALEYTIEKTSNANEYKLKFNQNIPDNTIVKLQYVKNQITENSWAYQTSNKLSITKTYPGNDEFYTSKNTVIDIEFSYAGVENFQDFVQISPEISGSWTHLGKIWRFYPSQELEETVYSVKINRGLTAEDQVLENDYTFKFGVDEASLSDISYSTISIDGIITTKTDEDIKIQYTNNTSTKGKFGKTEISRFENIDDFIQYLETKNYEKAQNKGEYETENYITSEYEGYLKINNKLEKGFYVAKVRDNKGKEMFNVPIQVTQISAYSMETERDSIIWVAKDDNLAPNINIEYQGKTVKTDNQGIAKFENIADGSQQTKYAKVENELVIGIYNYSLENYPYSYIYTDRPLYKNTDTINIWGFVPRKLFYDKIDEEFYIQLGEEQKQRVNVDKDGNFIYKIELKNHLSEEGKSITLYYKDTPIAYREISIQNYELQNYIYEVLTEKKYAKEGETIDFDVKVTHITGLIVPNKNVTIKMGENYIDTKLTGEDGIAHFEIKLDKAENTDDTDPMYQLIEIYNGDENEYTTSETEYTIVVLKRNAHTVFDETEAGKVKATLYKLDDDRQVNEISYDLKELYNGTYETEVDIKLREAMQHKYIEGYTYNEYTKENEPSYYYGETTENVTKIKTVTSNEGKVELNYDELKIKEDTDDTIYYYYIEFEYKDLDGKNIKDFTYYYKNNEDELNKSSIGYHNSEELEEESYDRLYEAGNIDYKYNIYRYFFKHENKDYKIGDKITLSLSESTKDGEKEIQNTGKLLMVVFKENITDTKMLTESMVTHEFTEKDFPGCKITASYFIDGRFYRMPVEYYDFDEEERKVDIEITPDRAEYKPGDEVNLIIKTTNNGEPIKTSINISVVNEAVFEVQGDNTDLVEQIYTSKSYAAYTYSSYKDVLESSGGGGGGGGTGPIRSNFSDTTYFEVVSTNNNGEAKVKFKLPDNVTTYRVTAHATNKDLYLGVNTKNITSKLNFFIQSTEPRGIKSTDDAVLNVTSIADTKYNVDYEFYIKELNKTITVTGTTNSITTANFGKLPIGEYTAVISGKYENQEDRLEYKFKVAKTLQEVGKKTTVNINNQTKITPSKNPIVLEIYNKNMSKYIEYIDFIESTVSSRLDTQIAYNKAQEIKEKYYGVSYPVNQIQIDYYFGETYLKNLKNGTDDIILTALTNYYAKNYGSSYGGSTLQEQDNVFEYYLLQAAKNEPVLNDLLYLKDEENIENYNKLLVTLGLEFLGDFQNSKELYNSISLTQDETKEYKSLIAIIETFIDKQNATIKIDELIANKPADEYLRYAILSYFQNNSNEMGKTDTVTIASNNVNETIELNSMQIKTYTIYDKDLEELNFKTESQDLMVSYYYQTSIENIESENIQEDIKIVGKGELKKGNTIKLIITFDGDYEGSVRIALPNSLRLAKNYNTFNTENKYYMQNNNIEYVTLYKMKECKKVELPLLIINEGTYYFEPIVCQEDNMYHISNSTTLNIE